MTDNEAATTDANAPTAKPETSDRPLGFALGIGVFVLPIVFVWFLLRKGYSTGIRTLGFIWLALSIWLGWAVQHSGSALDLSSPTSPAEAFSSTPATVIPTDEPLQVGGLAFAFEDPQTRESVGIEGLEEKASDGGVLVVVRYTMRNNSNRPIEAYSIPEIALLDPDGVTYAPDAGKTGTYAMETHLDQKLWSALNPGITVHAAQVFEVSKASYNPATWRIVIPGANALVAMSR